MICALIKNKTDRLCVEKFDKWQKNGWQLHKL